MVSCQHPGHLWSGISVLCAFLDAHFIHTRASSCGRASCPRKRASRGQAPWALDACVRRHDVLLVSRPVTYETDI